MATDTSKITQAANDLGDGLAKGGGAAKTLGAEIVNAIKSLDGRVTTLEAGGGGGTDPVPPNPNTAAMDDCITQNTVGKSEAFPMGVPHGYSWYPGKSGAMNGQASPPGMTAMTWWAQVHCEEGQPVVAGTFQVLRTEGWVRLKTGAWSKIQDQASGGIGAGTYPADFQGDGTGWTQSGQPDGSAQGVTPSANKCVHWWPSARGVYTADSVDGVWGRCDVKINGPSNMRFVMNAGCDWWKTVDAPYLPDLSNNPAVGTSNWIKAKTSYRTIYYTCFNAEQLKANPPPPLK